MNKITTEIIEEVERATRKFPTWPSDPLQPLAKHRERLEADLKEVEEQALLSISLKERARYERYKATANALQIAVAALEYELKPVRVGNKRARVSKALRDIETSLSP